MRSFHFCLILSAVGVGVIPNLAQANGFGLFRRNCCQPAPVCPAPVDPFVCPPALDSNNLPPPPAGFKWVIEKKLVQVPVQRTVIGSDGRPRTITTMETREVSVPRLVADTTTDLPAQVAELRRALGVAADAELLAADPEIRKRLITIKVKLGLVAVTAPAAATDATLSVSFPLTAGTRYKIGSEIVLVTAVTGTTLGPTTVTVTRGQDGTAAAAILAGGVIEPTP
jgi:hypothetical protein